MTMQERAAHPEPARTYRRSQSDGNPPRSRESPVGQDIGNGQSWGLDRIDLQQQQQQQQQLPPVTASSASDFGDSQRRTSRSPSCRQSILAEPETQAGTTSAQAPASRPPSSSVLQQLPLERISEAGEDELQHERSPRDPWRRQSILTDKMSCVADLGSPRPGMSRSSTMQTNGGFAGAGTVQGRDQEALGGPLGQDRLASEATRQWIEAQPPSTQQSGAQTPVRASISGMAGLEAIQGMLDNLADQLR